MNRGALADPLCGSLCDLGASVVSVFVHFHHRDTENHRDRTEKSLTQLEPMTFSAAC